MGCGSDCWFSYSALAINNMILTCSKQAGKALHGVTTSRKEVE